MIGFPWVPIPHEKIGTIYLPLCEIEIQNSYGEWITFVFKVDSGADMTLMEAHDYLSLGYSFDNDLEIDSTSIRDRKFSTIIGNLNMKIGNDVIKSVPVAFSKEPIQTLLLGRFKVFDHFEICFDHVKKRTGIRHF
jgi:hypothetical protein